MKRGCSNRWLRFALALAAIAATVSAAVPSSPSTESTRGQSGNPPSALSKYLRTVRLINYFPSDAGWQFMWTRWEPERIDDDFAVMATMGANAVRVTVFPDVMGFPTPNPVMQSRLSQIVSMAGAHELKVQLSLFDQFTDFADISGSLTWARDILDPLGGSSHVEFVDLRNELDAPSTMGNPEVYQWADALLPAVERDAHGVQSPSR